MAFKRITKKLYMEPIAVTGESVGTGDGTEVDFVLDCVNPKPESLVVCLDGTPETGYTLEEITGTLTFSTAPGAGVDITADYTVGVDGMLLTATATTVVIGLQVANKHNTNAGAVTVKIGDTYLANAIGVPIESAVSPLSGKLVLETGDTLRAFASDDDLLDITMSYMEA